MECYVSESANCFLQSLINQSLRYGLKSPDTDLYDFGFGELTTLDHKGMIKERCMYSIHATCRFKIIWRNGEGRIDEYYEDTPCEKFHFEVQKLVGLKVKKIALSEKNDLWLDLGDCWIVFATFENGEESWRCLTMDTQKPHLVASNAWVEFS